MAFQQAADANPDSWEAHYNLGVSYLESGQTRSSVGSLEAAVDANPESGSRSWRSPQPTISSR